MIVGAWVVNCLLVVLQGPKGELAWTFVPEVTLKEVGAGEKLEMVVSYMYVQLQVPSSQWHAFCSCSSGGSSASSSSSAPAS